MKKIILIILCLTSITASYFYRETVSDVIAKKVSKTHELVIPPKNEYAKDASYLYIQKVNNFTPYSKQDLLNIIYSSIDNGWDTFSFYCPSEYSTCISDMQKISNDSITLSHINHYVHPYNSFRNIQTKIKETGEVNISINKVYLEDDIKVINEYIDDVIKNNYNESKSIYNNIKSIHDYIITNTIYDEDALDISATARGLFENNKATCNGYTDVMAIILSKLNIPNYKIATISGDISYDSTGHIWNAVYYDNNWLHMDLTWDDPVSKYQKDLLYHKYFLVDNNKLKQADSGNVVVEEHNFNKSIYLEFNDSIKDIISK